MTAKATQKVGAQPDAIHIKFVHKAGMWVKTTFKDGKQTQEWLTTRGSNDI